MNERNSDTWEKGFDLNSLPDVELLDGQEKPHAPAGAPTTADVEPEEAAAQPDGEREEQAAAPEGPEQASEQTEPVDDALPNRQIDPADDPFAGWVSGHPVAAGEERGAGAAAAAQVPQYAIVAAGEDPFAGRFAQDALPAGDPGTEPASESVSAPPLAEVVPIAAGRSESRSADGEPSAEDDAAEGSAMESFLAGLSDEELDRAIELFEQQVDGNRAAIDEDVLPVELLDPLSDVLASKSGEVDVAYRIEEIEDIIDARLPDAARAEVGWWSNRASDPEREYARAWVEVGWWCYPELGAGRVRFRRPL